MRALGTPQRPKPPTASVAPSEMSATASRALATTLSMHEPPFSGAPGGNPQAGRPSARMPSISGPSVAVTRSVAARAASPVGSGCRHTTTDAPAPRRAGAAGGPPPPPRRAGARRRDQPRHGTRLGGGRVVHQDAVTGDQAQP